ncbi:hypothetical protein COOONC_21492 [Cooperia oncophora]
MKIPMEKGLVFEQQVVNKAEMPDRLGKRGGGVCVLLQNNIEFKLVQIFILTFSALTFIGYSFDHLRFIAVYRPPKQSSYDDELCSLLAGLRSSSPNVVILGDLNHDIDWSKVEAPVAKRKKFNSFISLLSMLSLKQHVGEPTCDYTKANKEAIIAELNTIDWFTIFTIINRSMTSMIDFCSYCIPSSISLFPVKVFTHFRESYPTYIRNLRPHRERLFRMLGNPRSAEYKIVNKDFAVHLRRYLAFKKRQMLERRNMKALFAYIAAPLCRVFNISLIAGEPKKRSPLPRYLVNSDRISITHLLANPAYYHGSININYPARTVRFRKELIHMSTTIRMHAQVGYCFELVKNVDIIYFDLSEAFNKVVHIELLDKLDSVGIRGALLKWLKSSF